MQRAAASIKIYVQGFRRVCHKERDDREVTLACPSHPVSNIAHARSLARSPIPLRPSLPMVKHAVRGITPRAAHVVSLRSQAEREDALGR